jgi:hypothetical protein
MIKGNTYQIDEPQDWREYLASRWREDWTKALVNEVTKQRT